MNTHLFSLLFRLGSFFKPRRSHPTGLHSLPAMGPSPPHHPSGFCLAVTCSALPPEALTIPQSPLPWDSPPSPPLSLGAFTVAQGLHSFLGPLLSPGALIVPWGLHSSLGPHCPLTVSRGPLCTLGPLLLSPHSHLLCNLPLP